MEIKGTVENIIYRNQENGYSVIEIECDGQPVTCVGYFPPLSEGQPLVLQGEHKINPRYGMQFEVKSIKDGKPEDLAAIVRYLGSGLIKGIGPKTALAIAEHFGLDTMNVIESNPRRLSEVKGISAKKAKEVETAYGDIKKMQNAVMFLQKHDISLRMSMKIYEQYGEETQATVSSNPYKLVEDVDGIGFFKADAIAAKLGIEGHSAYRARAAIIYTLKEAAEKNGHTCLPSTVLIEEVGKLLGFYDNDFFNEIISDMILEQILKAHQTDNGTMICSSRLYFVEKSIAARIVKLIDAANAAENLVSEQEITHYEQLSKIELHKNQRQAVTESVKGGVTIITGGPGTGKTTIVKCILMLLKARGLNPLLVAPTGRAAKRLSLSCNHPASTIHRALEFDFNSGRFNYNETNPLTNNVIIVDEVSMVDVYLMNALLKAINSGASLILVGDKDQLPSVGAGNLLGDLIASKLVRLIELTQIYRQAEQSLIITNAHRINNGQMPELNDNTRDFFFSKKYQPEEILSTIVDMVTHRIPNYKNIAPAQIQVLSAMKNGVAGVDNINRTLQDIINPNSKNGKFLEVGDIKRIKFFVGDKVMQTVNNYQMEWTRNAEEGEGVYNGDIGFVVELTPQLGTLKVLFEDGRLSEYNYETLPQLVLAYAITIHKSQGCEFDCMIMAVTGGSPTMMTRNLLYTALTRAKEMAVLVGADYNIKRMVQNNFTQIRYSILCDLLTKSLEDYNRLYQ